MPYVIVSLLAIAVGVAVAGLPNDAPASAVIVVSASTDVSEPEADTTTTVPPETTVVPTTAASTTTKPLTTTSTTVPLLDRDQIVAAAVNGTGVQGAAGRVADQLEGLGYVDVGKADGTDILDFTVIYFVDGYEETAARMAADLDLHPDFIAPIADAPEIPDLGLVQLVAYVGVDRG